MWIKSRKLNLVPSGKESQSPRREQGCWNPMPDTGPRTLYTLSHKIFSVIRSEFHYQHFASEGTGAPEISGNWLEVTH